MAKGDKKQEDFQRRENLLRELTEFDQTFRQPGDEEEESLKEFRAQPRAEVPPPPDPPKSAKNPYGLQDIITFVEHDYFLGQTLTPMQKVILKAWYMGSEGNQHLSLNDAVTEGCSDCVWDYVRKREMELADIVLGENVFKLPTGRVPAENVPCLSCERFCPLARAKRFVQIENEAMNEYEVAKIQERRDAPIVDEFENELMLLGRDGIPGQARDQILSKLGRAFTELILVMGRRSGKSFIVALIALYSVYRLLKMGHPQKAYGLMDFDIVTVLNVAKSEDQAKGAIFEKIFSLVLTSPYFMPYVAHYTQTTLQFMTPRDLEEHERRKRLGVTEKKGTIHLISGHSNSSSLVGKTVIILIIDEMAEMAGPRGDDGKDKELYEKLNKSLATFGQDGKTVCISNPLYEMGEFYKLYSSSFERDHVLMFQVPTAICNPTVTQSYLEQKRKDEPESYSMHFEAQFATSSRDPFLPPEAVNAAFLRYEGRGRQEIGMPAIPYYAHLDPAYNSDMYALAIVHAEAIPDEKDKEGRQAMCVIVDHIHLWKPKDKHNPINPADVNQYVVDLSSRFNLAQVTYDHWNSEASIWVLKGHGINAQRRTFSPGYQDHIFQNLKDLIMNERIHFYDQNTWVRSENQTVCLNEATEAKKQFTHLEKIIKHNRPKIQTPHGINDDIVDAVAAAAFECLNAKQYKALARPRGVRLSRPL
ncbi:MAG: hypothetical protein JSS66_05215 [Armatimonadetes bacterium]|nr:hypothetical protein [Armatimonadota bacterium]